MIGKGQAAELRQPAVVADADAKTPAVAVVGFNSVGGGHRRRCNGMGRRDGLPAGRGFNYQSPSWTQAKSFAPGADNSKAIKMAFVRLVAITLI